MGLSFIDDSHLKAILLSSCPSSDSGITISSFEADQDLTSPAMSGNYASHVFHGLMCFTSGPSARIYNTTTRQLVVLPDIEESNIIDADHKIKNIMYHIGHDPVHDEYKVVCISGRRSDEVEEYTYLSEHWVYLLGGGGDGSSRWRKISCECSPHIPFRQGVNTNGRMHYLALVCIELFCVSFDINSGEISMLKVPEDVFWPNNDIDLIEYSGQIALLDYINLRDQGVMKLWVVEDEEKNMWSSKTLVLHPSQMHMVNSIRLRVRGTTPNGEVIFAPGPEGTCTFTICLYDLQKNHMRKVDIKSTPTCHLTRYCDIIGMDDVDNLIYL